MPARAVVWGVIIIFTFALVVSIIEYFVPLSLKFELNAECRSTLLKMENQCGLSAAEKNNLQTKLAGKGFAGIAITAPASAKQGEDITLRVEADYTFSRMIDVLARANRTQHMVYNKTSMARKVIN